MQKDGITIRVTFDDKEYEPKEALELQANLFRVLAQLKIESESE